MSPDKMTCDDSSWGSHMSSRLCRTCCASVGISAKLWIEVRALESSVVLQGKARQGVAVKRAVAPPTCKLTTSRQQERVVVARKLKVQLMRHAGCHSVDCVQEHSEREENRDA